MVLVSSTENKMKSERWALVRGDQWVVAKDSKKLTFPPQTTLGQGTKQHPIILMRSYEVARDLRIIIKSTVGILTEIRRFC